MITEQEKREFAELSAIVKGGGGFMSLKTKEERLRYQELSALIKDDATVLPLTKGEVQKMIDNAVSGYKKEIDRLSNAPEEDLGEVKKFNKWIKDQKPKERNRTARLRVYREDGFAEAGVIVDMKFLKKAFNEESRKFDIDIYRVDVVYDEGIKTVDLPLTQIMQINEFETVEIIKSVTEEQKMIQGQGVKPYTKGGYSFSSPGMFGTKDQLQPGETFDYEVKRKQMTCTVLRPNGETLVLDSSKLNQ